MNQVSWNIGFGTKWMIETLKDVGKGSSKSISKDFLAMSITIGSLYL